MLRWRASVMGQGDNMVELFRGPGELEPRRAKKDAGSRVYERRRERDSPRSPLARNVRGGSATHLLMTHVI